MQITVDIPDEYVLQLDLNPEHLSRRVLETLVVDAYKAERLTSAEVGLVLNLSRFEVDAFLKEHQAYLHYAIADFHHDLQTLQHLQSSSSET